MLRIRACRVLRCYHPSLSLVNVFAMPYAKDSAMTFVDYRDVAEVTAIAFASDRLVTAAVELAAGGMLSPEGES